MYTYFMPHLCRYQMKFYVNCQATMMMLFPRWMIAEHATEKRIEKVINVSLCPQHSPLSNSMIARFKFFIGI